MLLSESMSRCERFTTPMKPSFSGVYQSREYVERVRARIHQVQLRQDPDCPPPLGVYGPRELEQIRVGEVDVCSGDGKDNTGVVWVAGEQARLTRSARVTYQLGFEM
jgi:hypothetical protein